MTKATVILVLTDDDDGAGKTQTEPPPWNTRLKISAPNTRTTNLTVERMN